MTSPTISLQRVSKRYRIGQLGARSIREELTHSLRRLVPGYVGPQSSPEDFFALRDVTLDIQPGETIGIIGPNGSGKSTILKLLAHIIFATHGRISVRGSVASLIEVGAGFHPELTGRENVYLYGSMMGMRGHEVRARFDEIVGFAGIEKFLDIPLKRYSSGMYVRLGFSVAAHINPDILLLDEVLAVGDAAFQSKCLERVEILRRAGMTIAFVSHDMAAIERLCNRVYFLEEGQVRSEGEPRQVVRDYYDTVVLGSMGSSSANNRRLASEPRLAEAPEIVGVRFFGPEGYETDTFATGHLLVALVEYSSPRQVPDAVFELSFSSPDGRLHCQLTTRSVGELQPRLPNRGVVEITCEELGLSPGVYLVEATMGRNGALDVYDRKPRYASLRVLPGTPIRGMFYTPHRWRLLPVAAGQEVH